VRSEEADGMSEQGGEMAEREKTGKKKAVAQLRATAASSFKASPKSRCTAIAPRMRTSTCARVPSASARRNEEGEAWRQLRRNARTRKDRTNMAAKMQANTAASGERLGVYYARTRTHTNGPK